MVGLGAAGACLLALALVPSGVHGQCYGGECSSDSTCSSWCTCRDCRSGHYCSGSRSDGGFCRNIEHACPSGKYGPYSGETDCRNCPAGQYQSSTGATGCRDCENGRYQPNTGYSGCIACSAGHYLPAPSSGHYWTSCLSCGGGQYQPSTGQTSCRNCAHGRIQPNTGHSDCISCSAGQYSGTPIAGQFWTSCGTCRQGSYTSSAGQTSCRDCTAGQYQPETTQTGCISCEPGTYVEVATDSTHYWRSCKACPEGQYQSGSGHGACISCGSGQYLNAEGSRTSSDCRACGSGQYAPSSGASSCRSCSSGQYAPSSGGSSCRDCSTGQYASGGASACISCSAGRYAAAGSATCGRCEPGTTDHDVDPATPCAACEPGLFGPGGADDCVACGPDASADYGGTFDADSDPSTPCTQCPGGTHPQAESTDCGPVDTCYQHEAECSEAHPAAICVLPLCKDDEPESEPAYEPEYNPGAQDGDGTGGDAQPCHTEMEACVADTDCATIIQQENNEEACAGNSLCAAMQSCMIASVMAPSEPACIPPSYSLTWNTIEERDCVSASLPTTGWERGRPGTPAEEFPTIRDACDAGLVAIVSRTADWLALAVDYHLQVAEGNAGVIATQLCLERRYESLGCLGSSAEGGAGAAAATCEDDPGFVDAQYGNACQTYVVGGRNHEYCNTDVDDSGRLATDACPAACGVCSPQDLSSPTAVLADLHDQACALSEAIGKKGHSVDTLLSTSRVPPLSFSTYHTTFSAVQQYTSSLNDAYERLGVRSDFQTTLSATVGLSAADAVDEQGLWQQRANEDADQMQVYRSQIQEIDATLQQTMQSMQLDGPALLQSVSGQLSDSRRSFQSATSAPGLRVEERAALEQSVLHIANQQASIQRQLSTLNADQQQDRQQLQHQLSTLRQRQSLAQQRLDDDGGTPPTVQPTCSTTCAGRVPPSSNGCGTDLTGSFHSWAMQALEDVTGCYSVPYVMNDMQSCCDQHDYCYGTCGVTQAFCDQQLRDCMQSQASLPECQTAIDASSLAVQLLGCDHFIAAQEESVAQQCRSTDADQGCTGSCTDEGTCLQTAEHVCDTVGAIAGAIVANPVGDAVCTGIDIAGDFVTGLPLPPGQGICHEFLAGVQTATESASYALSVVDDAWDSVSSWFGRRLQQACGDLDPAACQQMQQRVTDLQEKLQSARRLIATASSLASLNIQLLGTDEIDPAAVAKLEMSFLDLDMLNDQVLVDTFGSALGDSAATYETEVRQVVTLIRSKLEQTRAYYQAAMSKQDNERQRNLLGRRAQRAAQLVAEETDVEAQLAMTQEFLDTKLRAYSHVGLQYVIQEARAYEYLFLQPYTDLNLDRLRSARMTGSQYNDFVAQAETDLQTAFTRTARQFNNVGSSTLASTLFQLVDLPAAREAFIQTGEITLDIALPHDSRYYGVTFSDARAFLVGLPTSGRTPVTIDLVKGGSSVFKDQRGDMHRFTHRATTPPLSFLYDADSCTAMSTSDPRLQSGNMQDIYIRYSPYGSWKLRVDNVANLRLDAVTAIRFQFTLQGQPGRFGGTSVYFNDGNVGELGAATCGSSQHPSPPPPPPAARPPPPPATGGPRTCTTYPDFMAYSQDVTAACCDDAVAPCVAGLPTACSVACADVLLPMQASCRDFLGMIGMQATIDTAAASCPAPLEPCTSYPGFMAYSQTVTAACCDDAASPCVAGLPTACSDACSDVLMPMQLACNDFLGMIGMQDTINAAAATCGGGH